jgi:hypothetical protein
MLAGAIVVSFNLDPILGIELLFVGNAAWLATAVRSKDWLVLPTLPCWPQCG